MLPMKTSICNTSYRGLFWGKNKIKLNKIADLIGYQTGSVRSCAAQLRTLCTMWPDISSMSFNVRSCLFGQRDIVSLFYHCAGKSRRVSVSHSLSACPVDLPPNLNDYCNSTFMTLTNERALFNDDITNNISMAINKTCVAGDKFTIQVTLMTAIECSGLVVRSLL